ncbi:hypothetical protein [Sphingomonas mesophila]|uniref:hypothetical protein n=1 Tax=Sphingomonas mesophila TaxID=2303576 RepID=UPI0013C364C8|nr:hypothetical protein [Sphingomonas mesophila]
MTNSGHGEAGSAAAIQRREVWIASLRSQRRTIVIARSVSDEAIQRREVWIASPRSQ